MLPPAVSPLFLRLVIGVPAVVIIAGLAFPLLLISFFGKGVVLSGKIKVLLTGVFWIIGLLDILSKSGCLF